MPANTYDSSTVRAGTVRKNTAVALGSTDGDTQPLITDSTGHLYITGTTQPTFALEQTDLFGKQRGSSAFSLFNCQFLFDKKPLFWDELLAVGGTATFNVNTSDISMAVTTASGSRVVRQTKEYFTYQANRVHQLACTGVFAPAQANTNQYIGLGDDSDGVFFTLQGISFGVLTRTSTSGAPIDNFVPQSSFNIDKLDGTGPSGASIDLTKTQLMFIEYQWFGVGSVRWGMYLNGAIVYCHEVTHSNVEVVVYMKRGNLPVRYEIINSGVAASSVAMRQICVSVDSEGGYQPTGIKRGIDIGVTSVTVNTTLIPILSIQLKTAAIDGTIVPNSVTFLGTTADNYEYQVVLNPALTGASFSSVNANSISNFDTAASAMSGGTIISAGYSSAVQRVVLEASVATTLKLVASINGTTDIITLAARHVGVGTVPMLAAVEWTEFI